MHRSRACSPRVSSPQIAQGNLLLPRRRRPLLSLARALTPRGVRGLLPRAPPRVWLVDWGQCGGPTSGARRRELAALFLALAESDGGAGCTAAGEARVADALRKLGVVKGGEPNDATEAWTARGMFDSRGELVVETRSQQAANVRAGAASAAQGSVEALPKDLFLVLRVTQMLRGLGAAAEVAGAPPAGSIAETWRPFALRALREAEEV